MDARLVAPWPIPQQVESSTCSSTALFRAMPLFMAYRRERDFLIYSMLIGCTVLYVSYNVYIFHSIYETADTQRL